MSDTTVCGCRVQWDKSGGQGHCWVDMSADDLRPQILQEIEEQIIDGHLEEMDDFVASNGEHYRW